MPYVAPSTVSTLQTYTSAAHNIIVNDVIDHESRINTVVNTQYPYRNVLVNGDMQIAQRGTSVSGISSQVASNTFPTADRWLQYTTGSGTHTNALSADAPTGSGFRNSVRITCTTAITSLTASAQLNYEQRLEGQTLQHIKKGTSSAQQLTLSFWVKGNKTGASNTYVVRLADIDNTRSVSSTYTISANDTWEQKTITFPADTTGVLDNDNAHSFTLQFWLVAGSVYTSGTLATTWAGDVSANLAVGQTNLMSSVGNYWAVTGVQLEPGAVASPFEYVRYDDSLRRCQRYYEKSFAVNTAPATNVSADRTVCVANTVGTSSYSSSVMYRVSKRTNAVPTLYNPNAVANNARWYNSAVASTDGGSVEMASENGFHLIIASANQTLVVFNWVVSAEL